MQLTKDQIQQINNYLNAIHFDYDDLKPEILDHMISDIEQMMQQKEYDFQTAFQIEKIKWNSNFRDATSFYIGRLFSAPKIVINKANHIFKYLYFGYLIAYFAPILLFKSTAIKSTEFIQNIFFYLIILSMFLSLFVFFKTYQSKYKTVYSFIIKTQFFYLIIPLMSLLFYFTSKILHPISIALSVVSIYSSMVLYYLFNKHQKEGKKLKIQCN